MSNYVILNNQQHQGLRVNTQYRTEFGHSQMAVSLTISELRQAQRDYPIVFHFDAESQQYFPMALLGLEKDENMFLGQSGWQADSYIPAILRKGPFKIARQQRSNGEQELVISIDLDDCRVGDEEGELLFLPHGGNSPHTETVADVLFHLNSEREPTAQFCQQLQDLDLLEPLTLEIELDSAGNGLKLYGFYTIGEEKLAKLDGDILAKLSHSGFLQATYFCVASVASFSRLVTMKKQAFSLNS